MCKINVPFPEWLQDLGGPSPSWVQVVLGRWQQWHAAACSPESPPVLLQILLKELMRRQHGSGSSVQQWDQAATRIKGVWQSFLEEKSKHRKSDTIWLILLQQPALSCSFSALERINLVKMSAGELGTLSQDLCYAQQLMSHGYHTHTCAHPIFSPKEIVCCGKISACQSIKRWQFRTEFQHAGRRDTTAAASWKCGSW